MSKDFWQEPYIKDQVAKNIQENKQIEHNELQKDLQFLLESPQGKRFIKALFQSTYVFESMPIGNKEWYAWHEGRRSIGLMLYHRVLALGINYLMPLQGED